MTTPIVQGAAAVVGADRSSVLAARQPLPAPLKSSQAAPTPGGDEQGSEVDFGDVLHAQTAQVNKGAPGSVPESVAAGLPVHINLPWPTLFEGRPERPATARPAADSGKTDDNAAPPSIPGTPAIVSAAAPILIMPLLASPAGQVATPAMLAKEVDSRRASAVPARTFIAANSASNAPGTGSVDVGSRIAASGGPLPSAIDVVDDSRAAGSSDASAVEAAAPAQISTLASRSASVSTLVDTAGLDSSTTSSGAPSPAPVIVLPPGADPAASSAGVPATPASAGMSVSRQSLAQVLGERLQVQIARGNQNAVIRLDPPSMGSIEIAIHHEAGAVQVHLSASNSEVLTQLRGIGEALRQDLQQRQQGEVSVHISPGSRDGNGRQRQASGGQDEPGRALHEEADVDDSVAFLLARNRE